MADRVFHALRSAIITMRLKPGEALSEQEIAGRLNVSRQPVREAFIKLSAAGLVRVLPQRGTFVMPISAKAARDARFVRDAVECATARRAAEAASPAAITELNQLIADQRKAMRANDAEQFFHLDEAFHRGLAEAAGCGYAWKVIEEAKAQIDRVRFLSLPHATPIGRLIEQHRRIFAAVRDGKPSEAELAMRVHMEEILSSLPRLVAAFPHLFEGADEPAPGVNEVVDMRRRERRVRAGRANA